MSRMRFGKPVVIGCVTAGLFMVLRSASSLAQQPAALPPYPPTLTKVPAPAGVKVTHVQPIVTVPLKQIVVGELPKEAEQAVVFARPIRRHSADIKAGRIEFEVTADGPVYLAASWTYDGGASDEWKREALTEKQLAEAGWLKVARMDLWKTNEAKTEPHALLRRDCKAGEKFTLRTRKYTPPLVVMGASFAAPTTAAVAAKPMSSAPSVPSANPTPPAKPSAPATVAASPSASMPAVADPALPDHVVIPPPEKPAPEEVVANNVHPLSWVDLQSITVERLPTLLQNSRAAILPYQRISADVKLGRVEVAMSRDIPLLVAASFEYDGSNSEGWDAEAWRIDDFCAHGWIPVARITIPHRTSRKPEPHHVFVRHCRAGESFVFRSRKYAPPLVIVPAAGVVPDLVDLEADLSLPQNSQRLFVSTKGVALLDAERFDDLDRWLNGYIRRGEIFPSGHYKYTSLIKRFDNLNLSNQPELYERYLKKFNAWLERMPKSHAARLGTAALLISYSQVLRRNDAKDRLADADDAHRRAMELLYEVEQEDNSIPYMYHEYMKLARAQRWDEELTQSYFDRAVESKAWCPLAVTDYMLTMHDRYWEKVEKIRIEHRGGDVAEGNRLRSELRERFKKSTQANLRRAAEAVSDRYGDMLYAACVLNVEFYYPQTPFTVYDFDWPRLRDSFEELKKRYPGERRIEATFCRLASAAGDRETARKLYEALGPFRVDDCEGFSHPTEYELNRVWCLPGWESGEQRTIIDVSVTGLTGAVWPKLAGPMVSEFRGGLVPLDLDNATARHTYGSTNSQSYSIASSADGRMTALVTASGRAGYVVAGDLSLRRVRTLADEQHLRSVGVSPTADEIAAGDFEGRIHFWKSDEYRPTRTEQSFKFSDPREIVFVAYLDAGKSLLAYSNGEIRIWNLAGGTLQTSWRTDKRYGTAAAVSADGALLATADSDRIVRLWELPSGKKLHEMPAFTDRVESLTFSPDGRRLACGIGTHNHFKPADILLVDVAAGIVTKTLPGHKASITGLCFSPDGKSLLSSSLDRSARVWDVPE